MVAANKNVMALAAATGALGAKMPYINHKKVPTVNTTYIDKDIPEVSFVRMVLTACGKKETVVLKAAIKPIISM
jgi:hypothetical protein